MIFNMNNVVEDVLGELKEGVNLYRVNVRDNDGEYGYIITSTNNLEQNVGLHFSKGMRKENGLEVTSAYEINIDEFKQKSIGNESKKLGEL